MRRACGERGDLAVRRRAAALRVRDARCPSRRARRPARSRHSPPRASAARAPRRPRAASNSGRPSPTTRRSSASADRRCRECRCRRCGRDCRSSARRRRSGPRRRCRARSSVQSGAISRASRFADAYCGRTLLQSHWSSSQTIIAFDVQTPWPSSVCAMRIVTVSSGAITIHALISGAAGLLVPRAAPRGGRGLAGARRARRQPEAEHERAGRGRMLRDGHRRSTVAFRSSAFSYHAFMSSAAR